MLIEKECEKALDDLRVFSLQNLEANLREITKCNDVIEQLIKEHFNPQPYKREDLKKEMLIWDDELKKMCLIIDLYYYDVTIAYFDNDTFTGKYIPEKDLVVFEEGRFFPLTKALQYQGVKDNE